MRRFCVMVLVLLIISFSSTVVQASTRGVISCTPADQSMTPANWNIDDGNCVRVDLGVLSPGDILSFDIQSDNEIDILMFDATSISVYQNEQNYRQNSVWQEESVFEEYTGSGSWHWTAPSDRGDTRWYIVIDNMAHPQDQGGGSQGGHIADVTLDIQSVSPSAFGIVDSIVRLETDSYSVVAGPLSLDSGTLVNMYATTMLGAPDSFIMTQAQVDLYTQGGAATTYIAGTEMLLLTDERTMSWTVSEEYEGQNLYIILDNRAGPAGGGSGTGFVATTMVVSLTPVLLPVISNSESLLQVNVGTEVILDASNTPNRSNQISANNFYWDIDGDGIDDLTGVNVNVYWDEPENISIRLRIVSEDGRSDSQYLEIEVADISPPEITLTNSEIIRKDFDDELLLTAGIRDNWAISSVEWLMDGIVVRSYNSQSWEDGETFNFRFNSTYEAGNHIVTLRVTDSSGLISEADVNVDLYDSSPPIVPAATEEISVVLGTPHVFTPEAIDPESPILNFSWDFDVETDGEDFDSDPTNDVDQIGDQVTYSFQSRGTYQVVCTITNEEGISTQITYYVTVLSADEDTTSLFDPYVIAIAAFLIIVICSLVFIVLTRRAANLRLEELLAEQAAAEEEAPRELSVEEQKAMYGGGGSVMTQSSATASASPFGQYVTGMAGTTESNPQSSVKEEVSEIDISELLNSPSPIVPTKISSPAADLLAEFSEDEAVSRDEVVNFSHDDNDELTDQPWNSEDLDISVNEIEDLPTPPPPTEKIESIEEENVTQEDSEIIEFSDRIVQKDCSDCNQRFEVTLPDDHDIVRTACPECGFIETVSLTDN